MLLKETSIRRKLMTAILLTCGVVMLLTSAVYFAYEFVTFRRTSVLEISTLGKIIATNSTAALAFDDTDGAGEILSALRAERHIVAACLYDKNGKVFSHYPPAIQEKDLPATPGEVEYHFSNGYLEGYQPVEQEGKRLGILYLRSNTEAIQERIRLYGIMTGVLLAVSTLLAYLLSKRLQYEISRPVLELAGTAKVISEKRDYSVRANKLSNDELGLLTDAFNQMLTQIEGQDQKIHSFNQNLEQKVQERTSALEMANKELEAFSYSVSHDLRAPLRRIGIYLNILSERYDQVFDDDAKKCMNNAISNAQKMEQLIADLLNFSQLGKQELVKSNIPMKSLVGAIWDDLRKTEGERNIQFTLCDIADSYGDIAAIKQVWTNLLSNAIKYTRNRTDTFIEVAWEEKESEFIYSVKDNGAGFNMAYYHKLFGVFQRLHSEKEFEGTGVGLAIVERIISKHGGKIWAQSEVGIGTTFYFSLPNKIN